MANIYKCGVNPELLLFKNSALFCSYCGGVPLNPFQCPNCHKLIGKPCLDDCGFNYSCPSCKSTQKPAHYIVAKKLINEQEIKHIYCNQKLKIEAYAKHLETCKPTIKYKCSNEKCNREITVEPLIVPNTSFPACSLQCILKIQVQEAVKLKIKGSDQLIKDLFAVVDKNIEQYAHKIARPITTQPAKADSSQLISTSGIGACNFIWDPSLCPEIVVSQEGKKIFLNEQLYLFRSILSAKPFDKKGIYYWEIVADVGTENELKIGVTTKKAFNFNTAFCDYEHGFAYYGLGQLRHGSNSNGGKYGKPFKNAGVLGVCLNMIEGTLTFYLDRVSLGLAFKDEALKVEPIWPAISLLHKAGCTLRTGVGVPN